MSEILNMDTFEHKDENGTLNLADEAAIPARSIQVVPFTDNDDVVAEKKADFSTESRNQPVVITDNSNHYSNYLSKLDFPPPSLSNSPNLESSLPPIEDFNVLPLLTKISSEKEDTDGNLCYSEEAEPEDLSDKIDFTARTALNYGNIPLTSPCKKSLIGLSAFSNNLLKPNNLISPTPLQNDKSSGSCDNFDTDETDLQQVDGIGENMGKISNMTMIHSFNARFKENRERGYTLYRLPPER